MQNVKFWVFGSAIYIKSGSMHFKFLSYSIIAHFSCFVFVLIVYWQSKKVLQMCQSHKIMRPKFWSHGYDAYVSGKYIALSVYTIATISAITLPALYVVRLNVDAHYLILSTTIIVANTVVLCLVFIPKVRLELPYKVKTQYEQ